uniref:Uncharacterized protein n=1 Tax=Arion vulgaris TaxID=1028688 RepID=A0A0B7C5L2_9EUPU
MTSSSLDIQVCEIMDCIVLITSAFSPEVPMVLVGVTEFMLWEILLQVACHFYGEGSSHKRVKPWTMKSILCV